MLINMRPGRWNMTGMMRQYYLVVGVTFCILYILLASTYRFHLNRIKGGDDCIMNMWDTRSYDDTPSFSLKHESGVTSIAPGHLEEHIIITGSYDENMHFWDKRNYSRPLKVIPMGGGVWKLKFKPNSKNILTAACMRAGFKVLNINTTGIYTCLLVAKILTIFPVPNINNNLFFLFNL